MEKDRWGRDVIGNQTPVWLHKSGWGLTGAEKQGNQSPHQAPLALGTTVQRPGPGTPAFESQWVLSLGAQTLVGHDSRKDGGL